MSTGAGSTASDDGSSIAVGQQSERSSASQTQVSTGHSLDNRVLRAIFGDRLGLAIFLGSVCAFALLWRAGVFITDNFTLVATLEAISEGRLWIEPATSGAIDAPGTEVVDGYVYGRNYGQLFLSLPILWLLQALFAVADLTVALLGVWHLLALAFLLQLGHVYDARRTAGIGGSAIVLLSFLGTLLVTRQLAEPPIYLLGLQAATLVAASLVGVVLYRLAARQHGRRLGVVCGVGAALALPIGFWASVPKRHVFTTLICVTILYVFLRSRNPSSDRRVPVVGSFPAFRAAAYALVGLLVWIHAAEGLFVFLALVVVDVVSAPSNDRRTLALIGATFLLSVLPFLLTNLAITGAAHVPPRGISGSGALGTAGGVGGGGGNGGSAGVLALLANVPVVGAGLWLVETVASLVRESLGSLADPSTLFRTFVKSGGFGQLGGQAEYEGVNLAVLEAAPVLGGFVAVVLAAGRFSSRTGRVRESVRRSARSITATDALAGSFVLVFVLLFVSRLPLHTQITGRYLLPIYPMVLYLTVRLAPIRRTLDGNYGVLGWSYAGGVLIGGQLFLAAVVLLDLAVGEAGQLHGYVGLALALLAAVAVVAAGIEDRFRTPAAVALGLAAAAGTVFVLLAGLAYFGATGEHVLPWSRIVGDLIAIR